MGSMIPRGNIAGLGVIDAILSPALVAANTTAEQLFALPGVRVGGDAAVNVEKPTAQAGLGIVNLRVSANDQVGITFSNVTAGAITPTASERYRFTIARLDITQGSFQV